jgi:hypothetical protein
MAVTTEHSDASRGTPLSLLAITAIHMLQRLPMVLAAHTSPSSSALRPSSERRRQSRMQIHDQSP